MSALQQCDIKSVVTDLEPKALVELIMEKSKASVKQAVSGLVDTALGGGTLAEMFFFMHS